MALEHYRMNLAKSWGWRLSRDGETVQSSLDQPWTGAANGVQTLPLPIPKAHGVYDVDVFVDGHPAAAGSFVVGSSAPSRGALIQSTDFDRPDESLFVKTKAPGFTPSLSNDELAIEVSGGGWNTLTSPDFEDGVVQIDVPDLSTLDYHAGIGLAVREQDMNDLYLLEIKVEGAYSIYHYRDGQEVDGLDGFVSLDSSPDVKIHQLRALTVGRVIRFYFDGELVDVIRDAEWTHGKAGVVATSSSDAPLKIFYDNWRVWSFE